MDPITQGALGAACAQAALHKSDKSNAWIVGALSGMAADLDVLIRSSSDPMLLLIYHRHFTHSLLFIPLGGLLVAIALLPFKRFRKHWRLTLFASWIGYGTHGLLDACTSYGTLLYWPFSQARIAWDVISIVDPFFTLPLIIGVAWTRIYDDRRGVLIALLFAGLFLVFNAVQHQRALGVVKNYAQKQSWLLTRVRAFPELMSSTNWRIAAFKGPQLFLAEVDVPLNGPGRIHKMFVAPAFKLEQLTNSATPNHMQKRDFMVFNWFCNGYLIAVKQTPLTVVDARYLWGEPLQALWGVQLHPGFNHVKMLHRVDVPSNILENP